MQTYANVPLLLAPNSHVLVMALLFNGRVFALYMFQLSLCLSVVYCNVPRE